MNTNHNARRLGDGPIEKNVDEEEHQIIVHCRPRLTLRLEVEAHALVPAVRDRPEDAPPRVEPRKAAEVLREAQEFEHGRHVEKPGRRNFWRGTRSGARRIFWNLSLL